MTDDLDALLAEARALRPEPSAALLARVMADAEAARVPAPRPARPSWLALLADALGGWPALGGVAASLAVGVGLGLAEPRALTGVAASLWGEAVSIPLAVDADPLAALAG